MSVEETSFALLRAAAFPICCVSQPSAFSVIRVYKEERIDSKSLDPVSSGRQFLVIDQPNNGNLARLSSQRALSYHGISLLHHLLVPRKKNKQSTSECSCHISLANGPVRLITSPRMSSQPRISAQNLASISRSSAFHLQHALSMTYSLVISPSKPLTMHEYRGSF